LVEGFNGLELFTAASGGGTRPLLEWSNVEGADTYSVVVYDPEGTPYWQALTDETSIYVGGSIQLLEDRPGPRISVGSSWSVVALDGDQLPLAISGIASIGP
jgi:hypothetical protein